MGSDLEATAVLLASKGLLAADESTGTIGKRLEKAGLVSDEETRRAYRELFVTAPIGNSYSGVILYKETLAQATADGRPFVDVLNSQGVLPGIKVDEGLDPLEGCPGETHTRGLDTLVANCRTYVEQGARFAKWRAALRVDVAAGCPSERALEANAQELAAYAAVCQAAGLVPIVEPEVLIEGRHSLAEFGEASHRAIAACVAQLWRQPGLALDACLLKPQMIIPGNQHEGPKPSCAEVADATLRVMRRVVPPAIPGIMFLSGGQSEEEATQNLQAINQQAQREGRAPWRLSFSFGRALQASVLKLWSEGRAQGADMQQVGADCRAMAAALAAANAAASRGEYAGPHPSLTSGAALTETFRGWGGGGPAV